MSEKKLEEQLKRLAEMRRNLVDFDILHAGVLSARSELATMVAKAEDSYKKLIRPTEHTHIRRHGLVIRVTRSSSTTWDADILSRAWPQAVDVPGLVVKQIDKKEMERQVELGRVPMEAEEAARIVTQRTPAVKIQADPDPELKLSAPALSI